MRHLANGIYLENAYKSEREGLEVFYGDKFKDMTARTIDKMIYAKLCQKACDICRSHNKPISYYAWRCIRDGGAWESDFRRIYLLCDNESCMTFMLFKEL